MSRWVRPHACTQTHKLSSKQPDGPSEWSETVPWLFLECLRTGHWCYPMSPQEACVSSSPLGSRAVPGRGDNGRHNCAPSGALKDNMRALFHPHMDRNAYSWAGIMRALFMNIQASLLLQANLDAAISFSPFMSRWSENPNLHFKIRPPLQLPFLLLLTQQFSLHIKISYSKPH